MSTTQNSGFPRFGSVGLRSSRSFASFLRSPGPRSVWYLWPGIHFLELLHKIYGNTNGLGFDTEFGKIGEQNCKSESIDSKLGLILRPGDRVETGLDLMIFGVWTPFLINVNFGKFAVFDLCWV